MQFCRFVLGFGGTRARSGEREPRGNTGDWKREAERKLYSLEGIASETKLCHCDICVCFCDVLDDERRSSVG